MNEAKQALALLSHTNAMSWTLSSAIEDFLGEVPTGNSQIFAQCSPDTAKRFWHAVSDSTLMFGSKGIPLKAVWKD